MPRLPPWSRMASSGVACSYLRFRRVHRTLPAMGRVLYERVTVEQRQRMATSAAKGHCRRASASDKRAALDFDQRRRAGERDDGHGCTGRWLDREELLIDD